MNDRTILPRQVDGAFHRYCSPAHNPTDLPVVAARHARWHRRLEPAHLYAADSLDTMWAEFGKHLPAGYEGILAPSAARRDGVVLVVFAAFGHKLTVIDDYIAYGSR